MVTLSSPPTQLSASEELDTIEVNPKRMDGLLEELKTNMVDLILQGDEVTNQMWHMYSVFEELFGRQTMTTSTNQPLKHVVVGDKRSHTSPSTVISVSTVSSPTITTVTVSSPKDTKSPIRITEPSSLQEKVLKDVSNKTTNLPSSEPSSDTSSTPSGHLQSRVLAVESSSTHEPTSRPQTIKSTSNPLLETIGALATSNPDSDDSDLDVVYQQLRYRTRKPEQMRIRPHRTHRHQHQTATVTTCGSSDPESIAYAGSNSIDSGYKSLCATPEVTEVRRSASDVSASDSSTRSLEDAGKNQRIKMGTRAIRSPAAPMSDVTLDHLMYLRQSLRKDATRSPNESLPSSGASSTFRDSDLSPIVMTDEEWRDNRPHRSSESAFVSSRMDDEQEASGDGFLLSGVEYYDLESVHEFPQGSNYVTMMEEKTRRFQLMAASKCAHSDRPLCSLYRKRSDPPPPISLDGGGQSGACPAPLAHPSRSLRSAAKMVSRQHRATDSKLTEAAIRVLEMIEDFRMEEAMARSGGRLVPTSYQSVDPHYRASQQPPRYRKSSGLRSSTRPASTGSLLEQELDVRSVVSAEHHVYEEIMYDLVCERQRQPPEYARSRLLPVPPSRPPQGAYAPPMVDPRRVVVRHKHRSSSGLYSGRSSNVDKYLEMEWYMAQERRDNLPPDFPV